MMALTEVQISHQLFTAPKHDRWLERHSFALYSERWGLFEGTALTLLLSILSYRRRRSGESRNIRSGNLHRAKKPPQRAVEELSENGSGPCIMRSIPN